MKSLLPCAALLALALSASAEVIGFDSFDYPDGTPIVGATGGFGWDFKNTAPPSRSGTPSDWEELDSLVPTVVSGGRLRTLAGKAKREYNGTGVGPPPSNEDDGAVNGELPRQKVYYKVKVTPTGDVSSTVGLSSYDFSDERLFIGVPFGQTKFGIVDLVADETTFSGTDIVAGQTYTLVAKIDFANDTVALYVDPDLSSPESASYPIVSRVYTGTNWSTAVRLATGGFSENFWDDLMVATDWDDLKLTHFVTTLADSGPGSLRRIVSDAPAGSAIGFSPALSGGTITLTGGMISLTRAVTISGTGLLGGMTISGNHASGIFYVDGTTATLESLTLRDGNTELGGAVRCRDGNLTMRRCTVTGCSATFGGAVFSNTNLSGQKTTLINCTLTGNSSTGSGGAVENNDGDTELIHCTITDNTNPSGAGGGVTSFSDGLTRTAVSHSIIAGNTGGDVFLVGGTETTFVSSGSNLIGTGTGSAAFTQPGDLIDTDPMLAPLGNYGGPVATMRPLADSPAINPPTTSLATTDQRGFARDTSPDRGAVERGPILTVTTTGDSGPGSLRDTIAAVTAPDTRVQFDAGLSGQTITLTSDGLHIPEGKNLEIDANQLPAGITLNGNQMYRVISSHGILGLTRLTLTGGSSGAGGGIDSSNALLAVDSTFRGNTGTLGGAIVCYGGALDLIRCTISGNTAHTAAGLWQQGNTISRFTNCTFANNNSSVGPGTIVFLGGSAELSHTTISNNSSSTPDEIGGIFVQSPGTARFTGCVIAGNTGGGSPVDLGGVNVTASGQNLIGANGPFAAIFPAGPLVGTSAAPLDAGLAPIGNYGGLTRTCPPFYDSPAIGVTGTTPLTTDQRGIARSGTLTLGAVHDVPAIVTNSTNSGAGSLRNVLAGTFTTNVRFDPAVFNGEPADTIRLTTGLSHGRSVGIDGSSAPDVTLSGGGTNRIWNNSSGQEVRLKGLTLRDGLANDGGAVLSSGRLVLDQCRFIGNQSTNSGGGISSSGDVTLRSCEFSGNRAGQFGGSIIFGAALRVENSLFETNHATLGGGVMFSNGGTATLANSILASNTAGNTGGAIWIQGAGAALKLTHCTVTGNSAVGITWDSTGNTVTVENSIVAGNGIQNLARAPIQIGNNQISGSPKLAPLGQYGSGLRSMPPLPGSPAIEGGVLLATTPATDFRGAARPGASLPDLGGVEAFGLGTLGLASNDGDTIPDILEGPGGPYPHLSAAANDSARDTDGDGTTDADEIAASTDPLDPNSRLRITGFEITGRTAGSTTTAIDFTSFPGLSYSAEISPDLDFSDARVSSLGNATGFTSGSTLNLAPTERFVRIRVNP